MTARDAALEFCLPPDALPTLYRLAPFARRGGRAAAVEIVWHDSAAGELAGRGMSLAQRGGTWRLERAAPVEDEPWPPGTPPPLLAQGPGPEVLGGLPGDLMPVAGFRGTQRTLRLPGVETASLVVLEGAVRGVAQERAVCRIALAGPAPLLMSLSTMLVESVPATVPLCSLAAEAAALARGVAPEPRRKGAPEVPPGRLVGEAFTLVAGFLADVILAGAESAGRGDGPEPVHAMRVAVRRLRSALSVFRHAVGGPVVAEVDARLKALATVLGAARDWDVFLGGLGRDVAEAMPGEARLAGLLAAAERQRAAAYGELRLALASAEFRMLGARLVQLCALGAFEGEALDGSADAYAAALLAKRHGKMLKAGAALDELPPHELHHLRKQGKRLRYAAEFFAPAFGRKAAKRYLRRVAELQDALGRINDGASVAGLMKALGGGAGRHFAVGAVQGFEAARSQGARVEMRRSWARFRDAEPFWR